MTSARPYASGRGPSRSIRTITSGVDGSNNMGRGSKSHIPSTIGWRSPGRRSLAGERIPSRSGSSLVAPRSPNLSTNSRVTVRVTSQILRVVFCAIRASSSTSRSRWYRPESPPGPPWARSQELLRRVGVEHPVEHGHLEVVIHVAPSPMPNLASKDREVWQAHADASMFGTDAASIGGLGSRADSKDSPSRSPTSTPERQPSSWNPYPHHAPHHQVPCRP